MSRLKLVAMLLALFAGTTSAIAQQSNLSCSLISTPVTSTSFSSLVVTSSGAWSVIGNVPNDVINASLTDRADALVALGGTASLRVTGPAANVYLPGNYAGFVLGNSGLNLSALSNITLKTYLGGVLQETATSATMLSVSLGSTQVEVGFYTDKSYDAVEVEYTAAVVGTFSVYYPVMRGTGSCSSAATTPCNVPIHARFSNYSSVIDPLHTGISGITTNTWTGLENIVDGDTTNAASLGIPLDLSVLSTATLGVKNTVANYPAGYFAGFDIQNTNLLSIGALTNITINTYRNDTLVGTATGTGLVLGAALAGSTGRQTVGFVAPAAFDEVELSITQPVGVSLGTTNVFGTVIRNFCAGPALVCNTPTSVNEREYPVYVNSSLTGFSGAACTLCSLDSVGNLLDANPLNATRLTVSGALAVGSIAVHDQLTVYPGGSSYAGFEIENPTLLNVNVLSTVSIGVYRAGVLKQTSNATNLLVNVPSSLLGPGSGRYRVGFVPDSSFDEMRLNLIQPAAVTLGTTLVYNAQFETFCAGPLVCRATTFLNSPAQSVYIDQALTGSTGTICAGCTVNSPENAISASTTDFSQLTTVGSIIATTSLAVRDAINTYPARTIAGFAFQDVNNILQVNLLQSITISTYNNGVFQESGSATSLLNLSLLVLQLNPSTGYYNLGIQTTRPFDEIRIGVTPVAGVGPVLNIFGAYVDTRFADTLNSTTICARAPVADPDHLGMPKNTTVGGNLRINDHDPLNLALTYAAAPVVAQKHGTLTINPNGTFSYTPTPGFVGLDSFAYSVCNSQNACATAWAYVSVLDERIANAPNVPHIVQPDRSETLVNVPVSGNAAANDVDIEQRPLTYTVAAQPLHGTLSLTTTGQYIYTPEPSYIGTDSAYITVCDTATPQICRSARLMLVIYPASILPNNPPFAEDDVAGTRSGQSTGGNVLTNDKDPDANQLTATPLVTSLPATTGAFAMLSNGTWSFNPVPGFVGTVNIPYAISDGAGGTDTATLSITTVPYVGPDYIPLISILNPNFPIVGTVRDFRVAITEVQNSINEGQLSFRIFKPSAFTIIASDTITTVNVGGTATTLSNANWIFTETPSSVVCTLKPGLTMPAFAIRYIGFRLQRKSNIPANTTQNLTVGITSGSGGDGNINNNQTTRTVTAQ